MARPPPALLLILLAPIRGNPEVPTLLPLLAHAAAFTYYRIRYIGPQVARAGPAILVANHPNSLLDPVLVMAAAGRSVRFLAKAPLFADPKTAWLVRLGGAIPVHRRQDDPGRMDENAGMFAAVHCRLATGQVVGLFPEGTSHSAAPLAPLKTGAARIALGAAGAADGAFPIIPIGLVFRAKDTFRSEALVVRGLPIDWSDLAGAGDGDANAVRELTERIAAALARQTVDLAAWQDRPLVETAVRIWEAEQGVRPTGDGSDRIGRLAETIRLLAKVRETADPEGADLADEVAAFGARLRRLGLGPADLGADVSMRRGVRWAAFRLPLVLPLWALVGALGWLIFLPPYWLTGVVVARFRLEADTRSSWKALIGAALYLVWVMLLTLTAALFGAGWWSALIGASLPVVGLAGLLVRERWRGAWRDVRRFLLLRSRRRLVASLHARQRDLAGRLDRLHQRYSSAE